MNYTYHTDSELLLQVEVPGIQTKNIKITVENNELHIRTNRDRLDAKCIQAEMSNNRLHHVYQLERTFDVEGISATLEKGILSLHIRKGERKRNIPISVL